MISLLNSSKENRFSIIITINPYDSYIGIVSQYNKDEVILELPNECFAIIPTRVISKITIA